MKRFFLLAVWFSLFGVLPAEQNSRSDLPSMPEADQCMEVVKSSKKLLPTLDGHVGMGWDPLREVPMAPIFESTFKKCLKTPDHDFLIPDGVRVLPVKRIDLERLAEYYDNYKVFFESTTDKIVVGGGFAKLSGSFSETHEEIKEQSLAHNTSIIRIGIRYTYGIVLGPHDGVLSKKFKNRLGELEKSIKNNDTDAMFYVTRLLTRDYGTMVTTRVKVGAEITLIDCTDAKLGIEKKISIDDMKVSIAAAFFNFLNLSFSFSFEMGHRVNRTTMNSVYALSRHRKIMRKGGPNVNEFLAEMASGGDIKNMQLSGDDIVFLEQSGEPLYGFITPGNLPEFEPDVVYIMARFLKDAADEYVLRNTRKGCTDSTAENFDSNANVDDGTCEQSAADYQFAGIFQTGYHIYTSSHSCGFLWMSTCTDHSWSYYKQENGLTGDYSCPQGSEAIQLLNYETSYDELKMYWCKYDNTTNSHRGYIFGGTYSSSQINPSTGSNTCPPGFVAYTFAYDVKFCLSEDHSNRKYSVPLASFYSCKTPAKEAKCPLGYSPHLATIVYGCQIYYCVRPKRDDKPKILPVNRPPYGEILFRQTRKIKNIPQPNQSVNGYQIAFFILLAVVIIVVVYKKFGKKIFLWFCRKRRNFKNSTPTEQLQFAQPKDEYQLF